MAALHIVVNPAHPAFLVPLYFNPVCFSAISTALMTLTMCSPLTYLSSLCFPDGLVQVGDH